MTNDHDDKIKQLLRDNENIPLAPLHEWVKIKERLHKPLFPKKFFISSFASISLAIFVLFFNFNFNFNSKTLERNLQISDLSNEIYLYLEDQYEPIGEEYLALAE